jgi:hypothetical protein
MKIAILLPGHIRFWKHCKENFLEKLYDIENHSIDVFIDTYYQLYRSDAVHNNEAPLFVNDTEDNIRALFNDLNVVSFNIEEQEFEQQANYYQLKKLNKIIDTCLNYQKANNFEYDLVVRSRFDIIIDEKINYLDIKNNINVNDVYIPEFGPPVSGLNDMLAITNFYNLKKYTERSSPNNVSILENMNGLYFRKIYKISLARNAGDGIVTWVRV